MLHLKLGIVQKLLFGILLPLILVLGIIGVILGMQVSNTVKQLIIEDLNAEAESGAEQVDAFFERYFGAVDAMAQSNAGINMGLDSTKTSVTESAYFYALQQELAGLHAYYGDSVLNIWYADVGTKELLSSDGTIYTPADLDITSQEWYTLPLEKKDTVATSAYSDVTTQQTVVTISRPVMIDNQVIGVRGIDVALSDLSASLSSITIGTGGYISLLDSANTILYHTDSSVINKPVAQAGYSENMTAALLENQDVSGMSYTRNGQKGYGSAVYLPDLGYQVLGAITAEEFEATIVSTVRIVVISFVLCAILVAGIVAFLAISITSPLKRLNKVAVHLANGEFNVDYHTQGKDEVAQLGQSTMRIVDRLKTYIQYIDELSSVLDQIGKGDLVFQLKCDYQGEFARLKESLLHIQQNLSATLSNIAQSAVQVNLGAEQIATGSQGLALGATQQASSVQELSDTVQGLEQNVSKGAEQAGIMLSQINQMKEQVLTSNGQMQDMLNAMEDISHHSNDISKIIKTIDDIAFQTNILALNAAVEAARAGEAGKGFAVVADEVRSLAAKSAAAAKETNDLIARSALAVSEGENIARSTADTLSNAAETADEVATTVEQVTRAYQEQADHLKGISTGVDQISNVVQTNSATAQESAAASEELAGQAASMQQQISMFHISQEGDSHIDTSASEQVTPYRDTTTPSVQNSAKY